MATPATSVTCSRGMVEGYQKRIFGPLMDRIDIHVEVPPVDYEKLSGQTTAEPSSAVRARLKGTPLHCNADMGPAEVRQLCALDTAGRSLINAAMTQMGLSARAYHRVLKLVRTIADLAGALQYRRRQGE